MPALESMLPAETTVGNHFISNYPPFSTWKAENIGEYFAVLEQAPRPGPLGLYVHLPFCRQRCHYCYFRVYPRRSPADVERYTSAVLCELKSYAALPAIAGRPFTTVYFGGGSPSFLECDQLTHFFSELQEISPWDQVEECTFECEPGTVSLEKFRLLKNLGVTRISLGFQSLDDEILRRSGRDTRIADCFRAYRNAREAGFSEINIDLLAGLPGETEQSWLRTMDQVLELLPECVTIYQLELTHNSALYASMQAGRKLALPDWPSKQAWTQKAFEMCERAGYTIASGYMAVREPAKWRFIYTVENLWHGADLLALGETAFGHIQGVHYQNLDRFDTYTTRALAGQLPVRRALKLSDEEKLRREVILQLKVGMLCRKYFREKFHVDPGEHFAGEFDALLADGYITVDENCIRLTRAGLLRVDWLLPLFYLPEHRGIRYT